MDESGPTGRNRYAVLFVCLGNICRSPLAEGIFGHLVREEGLENRIRIDSAGTGGWHSGEPADSRARRVAAERGVELTSRARQVREEDFAEFDLIVAMDRSNRDELARRSADPEADPEVGSPIRLLRSFDPESDPEAEVPDPYYGSGDGFTVVFDMIDRACHGLLDSIRDELR